MSTITINISQNLESSISNSIDEVEFPCIQPIFRNGIYEGSKFVLIDAVGLPDNLRIYMNTGEFGFVKDEKCLIRLENPMVADSDVWCYISTDNCEVESCTYTVGRIVSGSFVCSTDENDPIPGTLSGEFVCDTELNLRQVVFDDYGNPTMGEIYFEDCIYCGGDLPNCEEVP